MSRSNLSKEILHEKRSRLPHFGDAPGAPRDPLPYLQEGFQLAKIAANTRQEVSPCQQPGVLIEVHDRQSNVRSNANHPSELQVNNIYHKKKLLQANQNKNCTTRLN